jgi:thiamine biosynthesis lipoprotein
MTTNEGPSEATVTAASLNGWQQYVHLEDVWGTTIVIDVRGPVIDETAAIEAIATVQAFFQDVDAWFSTYRYDTPITMVRNGLWDVTQAPEIVQEVLAACASLRTLTDGAFDPWAVPGGVDPSGYVKGWAADIGAEILVAEGFANVSINAAGDIACRGFMSPDEPWAVGIRHPEHTHEIIKVVHVTNGAIATSGLYERGAHIVNPRTGDRSMSLDSATVIGPDGGMADALATACLVEGFGCAAWFAGLPDWSVYLVKGEDARYFGPAFAE